MCVCENIPFVKPFQACHFSPELHKYSSAVCCLLTGWHAVYRVYLGLAACHTCFFAPLSKVIKNNKMCERTTTTTISGGTTQAGAAWDEWGKGAGNAGSESESVLLTWAHPNMKTMNPTPLLLTHPALPLPVGTVPALSYCPYSPSHRTQL